MSRGYQIRVDVVRTALREATEPGQRWSRRALSLAAGLGPDAVRDIISGKSKAPGFRTVTALADVLGISSAPFFGKDEDTFEAPSVPIIGSIEPGVWREKPVEDAATAETIPAVMDLAGPSIDRFALRMRGLSMDELFVPEDILYCEFTNKNQTFLMIGDLAVIRRERNGLFEVSAREIIVNKEGEFVLVTRTTVPDLRKETLVEYLGDKVFNDKDGQEYHVFGVVRGVYRPIRGAPRAREVSRKN